MNEYLLFNKSIGIFMVVFKYRVCFFFFFWNDYMWFIFLKIWGGVLIMLLGGFIVFKMIFSYREIRILLE